MRVLFYLLNVVFFLLLAIPANSKVLEVPIYGTYNFNTNSLNVFWKTSPPFTSYKAQLYKRILGVECSNIYTDTLLLENTTNSLNTTFNNLLVYTDNKTRYYIKIFGSSGTTDTLLYVQEFYIYIAGTTFQVSWSNCNVGESSTVVYYTTTPSFNFGEEVPVNTWQNYLYSTVVNQFTNISMIFVYKYIDVNNTTIYSGPSAQIILFSGLPGKPTWQGVEN